MNESSSVEAGAPGRTEGQSTAGSLLREARQAQGMHIGALAAAIKVSQKKLELLEADRIDQLPDATFTRALAQAVCRALKVDPAPVLALLPGPAGHRLEQVSEGLNEPFRDRPGRRESNEASVLTSVAVWGPLLIVVGAAALYFMPTRWLAGLPDPAAASPAAPASAAAPLPSGAAARMPAALPASLREMAVAASAPAAGGMATPVAEPAELLQSGVPAGGAAQSTTAPASADLVIRATQPSWVEVYDAQSKVLLARLVQQDETLSIGGQPPLRLKIGNAQATQVVFRGRPLDLASSTRENVARLELK